MAELYSNLKFLRYRPQLDALASGAMAPPVHIRIKPTNRCNHNCWYCAYRVDDLALGEDMNQNDSLPVERLMAIADDIVEMGVRAVTFSGGGEPLLYKELPRVIRRLAAGGVKVASLTNGSNLRGAMADAFAEHGSWIRVSLDAWDDASHARARSIQEGEFTRLMENIRAFTARGSACVLGVSFIVNEENASHLANVCAQLRDVGVNHVKVSGAVISNDREEHNAYHRRLFDLVTAGIERARALEGPTFKVIDHYHEMTDRFEKGYHQCAFSRFLTIIGADGNVYTCQDKAYTKSGLLGSLAGRGFKEFWFSDETRRRLAEVDPARDCHHHCVAHGKNLILKDYLSIADQHADFV